MSNPNLVPGAAHDAAEKMIAIILEGQKAWVEAERPDVTPQMLQNGAVSVAFSIVMSHALATIMEGELSIEELINLLAFCSQNFLNDLEINGALRTETIN
jgi:hypothetical protein